MLATSGLNHQQNSEKNQQRSQEKFYTPFDNIIPSLLLEEKGVKGSHIRLYGLIRSLTQKFGYCFATNCRLAATLECSDRNIRMLLQWLEEKGYIERKEEGDEFNPERHIYLLDPRQKILTRGRKVAFRGGGRLPSTKEEEKQNKNKENRKKPSKESYEQPPDPPKKTSPSAPFGSSVSLKKDEKEFFEKACNHGIHFKLSVFRRWVKKYGLKKIIQTYNILLVQKNVVNKEAWMEKMLTTDKGQQKDNVQINLKLLQALMKKYPNVPIDLHPDWFEIIGKSKDFSLAENPETFERNMDYIFEKENEYFRARKKQASEDEDEDYE